MKYIYRNNDKYAGFCATLNNAINVSQYYYTKYNNIDLIFDIPELTKIFEFKLDATDVIDFNKIWENSDFDNSSNAHTICDPKKIIEKKNIFDKFFLLKNEQEYFSESQNYIDDKTIGIHIRGTDKIKEIEKPCVKNIISQIKDFIYRHQLKSIYLATDDIYYRDILISEFSDIVKWRPSTISMNGQPIHFINDRSLINKEVMMDVYLLSKCKYFLYCFSNVSYTSLILGIHNFKEIGCINYIKDTSLT